MGRLLSTIDDEDIDYFVVDRNEVARFFSDFPSEAARIPQLKARRLLPRTVPELELAYSVAGSGSEPDMIYIYRVVRAAVPASRPATRRAAVTRAAATEEGPD